MHRFAAYNICCNGSGLRNTEDILLKLTTSFSCNNNLNGTLVYIKLLEGPGYGVKYHFQQYFNYIAAVSFIGGGNVMLHRVHGFDLITLMVIGYTIDCIGSCNSKYHMITATMAPQVI
jgi:hypothetical protein